MTKIEMNRMLIDHYKEGYNIPKDYGDLIGKVVRSHIRALDVSIGSLELCYLRMKQGDIEM